MSGPRHIFTHYIACRVFFERAKKEMIPSMRERLVAMVALQDIGAAHFFSLPLLCMSQFARLQTLSMWRRSEQSGQGSSCPAPARLRRKQPRCRSRKISHGTGTSRVTSEGSCIRVMMLVLMKKCALYCTDSPVVLTYLRSGFFFFFGGRNNGRVFVHIYNFFDSFK
jgi:hypothetical protein